ncbi:cytochrome c oxidase accessory protein CcoG [Marinicella sp. W31]|uniref:cytochrome c oxidase accessory protein CcoG n=1 Tax=Marinicella sp. W31 TaxID=3023713 RepID=UPI003756A86E
MSETTDTYTLGGTNKKGRKSLYQKREKIRPRAVSGRFNNLRVLSVVLLLGLYYGLPWLQWHGRQAVLFDLPARKFHIFAVTFWPQDFIFLTLLLILAALALFFFTALAGRLWCGYACPQTVWTEVFIWMERLCEGDRNQQIKLDKQPWNLRKWRIKISKHVLWVVFALFTGYTFVGYFTPIHDLTTAVLELNTSGWETFWILFYSFATWGNAGKLREQVCIYMCPYARFQSAMFDKDTLIIAYDEKRGEQRGGRKKSATQEEYQAEGLGDCIDCKQCVHVCPTGIDIRDGLQYACIACAACIDVCDDIMDKMGYDRGLIRYTTEHKDQGKESRILRPRTVFYAGVLTLITGVFITAMLLRVPLELDIIKDRNRLYVTNANGLVENIYQLRILNKDQQDHSYKISMDAENMPGLTLQAPEYVSVKAGAVLTVPVRAAIDPIELKSSNETVLIQIKSIDKPELEVSEKARFIGPVSRRR